MTAQQIRDAVRPLPVALAAAMRRAPAGSDRMALLNRTYNRLDEVSQLQTRAALLECRE